MLYSKIEGRGRPLLILHGFLGMSDNWKTLGTRWSEAGYEVHLLDLRNHGRSLHSEEFNYKVMAQDVFDYCKEKKLNSIYLMGHSMGGKVAMVFSTTYPEMVEKLIIADINVATASACVRSIFPFKNALLVNSPASAGLAPASKTDSKVFSTIKIPPCTESSTTSSPV